MFTGLVESTGRIESVTSSVLVVASPLLQGAAIGASVAVNGACLTVVSRRDDAARFNLAPETVSRTTLSSRRPGHRVNLERPLRAGAELGGHFVLGHVDGIGRVVAAGHGDGYRLRIRVGDELSRYVAPKGSVAVDGVSLTVASCDRDEFEVALIPHTLQATTLGLLRTSDEVNIEVDVLAKHVERLLAARARQEAGNAVRTN